MAPSRERLELSCVEFPSSVAKVQQPGRWFFDDGRLLAAVVLEGKVMMTLVGVMGPGEGAADEDTRIAYELGRLIAQQGWVLVTGGRGVGVMDAAGRGAKAAQGTVVGILPGTDYDGMSAAVDIPIVTGMHEARNNINVLSSRVLFFVGMSAGTASELSLALKRRQPAILVCQRESVLRFFAAMSSSELTSAGDAAAAVESAKNLIAGKAKTNSPEPG